MKQNKNKNKNKKMTCISFKDFRNIFIVAHKWGTACTPKCPCCASVQAMLPRFDYNRSDEMERWAYGAHIEWVMPSDSPSSLGLMPMPIARLVFIGGEEHACENCFGLLRCATTIKESGCYLFDMGEVSDVYAHICFAHSLFSKSTAPRIYLRLYQTLCEAAKNKNQKKTPSTLQLPL